MSRLLGSAWTGAIRYEFLMAARRKVVWLAVLPLLAIGLLLQMLSPESAEPHTAAARVGAWSLTMNLLVVVGLGVALADRFTGTTRRGLNELLLATPSRLAARMLGSLAGSLAAALAPVAVTMVVVGVVFTLTSGDVSTLGWAVIAFCTVNVPSALLLTTFAATLGLVLPMAVVRMTAVAGWFWATLLSTSIVPIPTITGTLLSPLGDYVAGGWLHTPTLWAGEGAFAAPAPSFTTAAVNLLLVVAMSAVLFTASCALARRRL
ncbi:hypothetical protein [Salinispora vitiensis]|uniref:hypothetical protein n=1 Tax=Salinispora vitiensis TaxID=999544 RepID=UPI00037F1546|nr:hypothetical protein [Salinispora vitiensis]